MSRWTPHSPKLLPSDDRGVCGCGHVSVSVSVSVCVAVSLSVSVSVRGKCEDKVHCMHKDC